MQYIVGTNRETSTTPGVVHTVVKFLPGQCPITDAALEAIARSNENLTAQQVRDALKGGSTIWTNFSTYELVDEPPTYDTTPPQIVITSDRIHRTIKVLAYNGEGLRTYAIRLDRDGSIGVWDDDERTLIDDPDFDLQSELGDEVYKDLEAFKNRQPWSLAEVMEHLSAASLMK